MKKISRRNFPARFRCRDHWCSSGCLWWFFFHQHRFFCSGFLCCFRCSRSTGQGAEHLVLE